MNFKSLKIVLSILLLASVVHSAMAQNALTTLGLGTDAPTAAAYSLRQLSNTYTGPLVRVTIGSVYYDVYPDANKIFSLNSPISAQYLANTTPSGPITRNLLSSVIGANTVTVGIWYDQSGNTNNATQVLTASQPTIIKAGVINTINGKPALNFPKLAGAYLASIANINIAGASSVNVVAQCLSNEPNASCIVTQTFNGNNLGLILSHDGNMFYGIYDNNIVPNGTGFTKCYFNGEYPFTPFIATATYGGTAINLSVNGIASPTATARSGLSASYPIFIGKRWDYPDFFVGHIAELVISSLALTGDQRRSIESKQNGNFAIDFYPNSVLIPKISLTNNTSTGSVGTSFNIPGAGFSLKPEENIVYFGATRATVSAMKRGPVGDTLTVTIPKRASIAPITVLNTATGLVANSGRNFTPKRAVADGRSVYAADFALKADFGVTPGATGVAVGDIDGDGKPDLVVIAKTSNLISILRNTSSPDFPSFDARLDLSVGATPTSIALGDIDGDGKVDIVTTNKSDNTVTMLRNLSVPGRISFAVRKDISTGNNPVSVAIGDINSDGRPDLAVCNSSAGTVSVLLNIGMPGYLNFAAKNDVAINANPYAIAIGYISGDQYPEVVTANSEANTVSVLHYNSVSGSCEFYKSFPVGKNPVAVMLNDTYQGIETANKDDASISILTYLSSTVAPYSLTLNNGLNYKTGEAINSFAAANVKGDDGNYIVFTNQLSGNVTIYSPIFNPTPPPARPGTTAPNIPVPLSIQTAHFPVGVATGDIDGDGLPDIVTANGDNSTVSVLLNNSASPPSVLASNLELKHTNTTISANWTNGNGSQHVVFFGIENTTMDGAVKNHYYRADARIGFGESLPSGWQCVYNGTGTSVDITGVSLNKNYAVVIYDYNTHGSNIVYSSTTLPVSISTLLPVTINISPVGTGVVNGAIVQYKVSFNGSIPNLTASNFALEAFGVVGASIGLIEQVVSNSTQTSYNVTVNTGSGEGTTRLKLINTNNLTRTIANAMPYIGQGSMVDRTAPVIGISKPSLNFNSTGDAVCNYAITYNDPNFDNSSLSASNITLVRSGTANATVSVTGSGALRTVLLSGLTGNGTLGVNIAAGTATDLAGNPAGAIQSASFSVGTPGK